MLYYTILCYAALLLQCTILTTMVPCYTMLYHSTLYYAILCYTMLYYTILYYDVLYQKSDLLRLTFGPLRAPVVTAASTIPGVTMEEAAQLAKQLDELDSKISSGSINGNGRLANASSPNVSVKSQRHGKHHSTPLSSPFAAPTQKHRLAV